MKPHIQLPGYWSIELLHLQAWRLPAQLQRGTAVWGNKHKSFVKQFLQIRNTRSPNPSPSTFKVYIPTRCGIFSEMNRKTYTLKSGVISCLSGEPERIPNYFSLKMLVLYGYMWGAKQDMEREMAVRNVSQVAKKRRASERLLLLPVFQPENHIWTKSQREDSSEVP